MITQYFVSRTKFLEDEFFVNIDL